MNFPCPNRVWCPVTLKGFYDADFDGWFDGYIDADFSGYLDGIFCGTINGTFDGFLNGEFTGTINGIEFSGQINQSVFGTIIGSFCGRITGNFTGHLTGTFQGYLNGHVNGDLDGKFSGRVDGLPTDPDLPFTNYSAELPDRKKYFGFDFPPGGPPGFCESFISQELANLCAGDPPDQDNGDPPILLFNNSEQTCSVDCEGETISATAVAGLFSATTQGSADAQALAFACQLVNILCVDGELPPVFQNLAQTCSVACPNGGTSSYTVPAGLFSALTQGAADTLAYNFACNLATLVCPPEGPPPSFPPGGGGGFIPPPEEPPPIYYANSVQFAQVQCADGSLFNYRVAAGLFFSPSVSLSNSMAKSYAQGKAEAVKFCLDQVALHRCVGEASTATLTLTGTVPVVSFEATGLPPGLTLSGGGVLSGTPSAPGIYQPNIRVTDVITGNYLLKTFQITVAQISTASLPSGVENEVYEEILSGDGFIETPVWSIFSGSLPTGLSLSGAGIISGTPTVEEVSNFSVQAVDQSGNLCVKAFSITIEAEAADFPLLIWTTVFQEPESEYLGDSFGATVSQISEAPFGAETTLIADGKQAAITEEVTAFLRLTWLGNPPGGCTLGLDIFTDQDNYLSETTSPGPSGSFIDYPQFTVGAGETNFVLHFAAFTPGSGSSTDEIQNFRIELILV